MPRLVALTVLCSLLLVASARAARHTVGISVFEFRSARLVIKAGDTVRWRWDGPDTGHSVTALARRAHAFDSDPGLSAGAINHPVGFVFAQRFGRPGRYRYFCRVHPSMRGVVVVRRPSMGALLPERTEAIPASGSRRRRGQADGLTRRIAGAATP